MRAPSEDGWHYFGKHSLRLEAPDVLVSRPDGDMSLGEITDFAMFVLSLPRPEAGFFIMIDVAKGGRLDPAALKLPVVQEMNRHQRAVAYLNAGFPQRTLVAIFQRAAKLLNVAQANAPIAFFTTPTDACTWFETLRKSQ